MLRNEASLRTVKGEQISATFLLNEHLLKSFVPRHDRKLSFISLTISQLRYYPNLVIYVYYLAAKG